MRRIVLAPGAERAYDEREWAGALVVVKKGEIELECLSGVRHRFCTGDLLWLVGMPLRSLRCCGPAPAVLLAISRTSDEFRPDGASNGKCPAQENRSEPGEPDT